MKVAAGTPCDETKRVALGPDHGRGELAQALLSGIRNAPDAVDGGVEALLCDWLEQVVERADLECANGALVVGGDGPIRGLARHRRRTPC